MTTPDFVRPGRDDRRDGWAVHEDQQRLHTLKLTSRQRLEWLEKALGFAQVAGALPQSEQHPLDDQTNT